MAFRRRDEGHAAISLASLVHRSAPSAVKSSAYPVVVMPATRSSTRAGARPPWRSSSARGSRPGLSRTPSRCRRWRQGGGSGGRTCAQHASQAPRLLGEVVGEQRKDDEYVHGREQHPPQEGAVGPNVVPELGIVIRLEGHGRSQSPTCCSSPRGLLAQRRICAASCLGRPSLMPRISDQLGGQEREADV